MKLKPHQRISYETAKARALKFLASQQYPIVASAIGQEIWPDNNMRAQGLGAAASRILGRMKEEGLVRFTYHDIGGRERFRSWGYVITSSGRKTQDD